MTTRATVLLDDDLLAEAKSVLGATTTQDVVDQALRDAVWRAHQRAAIRNIAGLDLDADPAKVHVEP